MIQPCYITKPELIPPGEPMPICKLRFGDKFMIQGNKGIYNIHATDPIKIKRPDGWIVRCGDENRVVFKQK